MFTSFMTTAKKEKKKASKYMNSYKCPKKSH